MKQRITAVLAMIAFIFCLWTGCRKTASVKKAAEYPVTVGNVELNKAPAKVAVLSPSLAEICADMGYDTQLCGRTDECDAPESVAALPSAGSMVMPDMDVLIGWKPDLVLAQSEPSESVQTLLKEAGIPVVIVPSASDFDGLKEVYCQIGQLFSGAVSGMASGEQAMSRLSESLSSIQAQIPVSASAPPITAVYVTDSFGHVATGDTVMQDLLTAAGAVNAAKDGTQWTAADEQISGVDVIFCPEPLVEKVKAMTRFSSTPAVKNGRVYGVSAAKMERQSDRMVEAVQAMAGILYPDVFVTATSGSAESTEAASSSLTKSEVK